MRDAVLADFLNATQAVRAQIKRVVLFGSRARGNHRTHSDYDLLVIVEQKSPALLDALYDAVVEVLLEHGRLVSLKIFEEHEYARLERLGTPFIRRIVEQGQPVG